MPHEELTPRSDSASTECSTSPPEVPGSNHSETSSGVHSNDSSEPHHQQQQQVGSVTCEVHTKTLLYSCAVGW